MPTSREPRELRTTLTSCVVGPSAWDAAPGVDVMLSDVPVINITAHPVQRQSLPEHGITMHAGTSDIPQIMGRRALDAQAQNPANQVYEIQATVQIGFKSPIGGLRKEHIADLQVLNLTRANPDTSNWLKNLIRDEIEGLFGADAENFTIATTIARHPRLLDELVRQPELSHVAVILWESAIPRDLVRDERRPDEPLISTAKLGTLYTADPARVELRTLNSEFVRAHLPDHVGRHLAITAGRVTKHTLR